MTSYRKVSIAFYVLIAIVILGIGASRVFAQSPGQTIDGQIEALQLENEELRAAVDRIENSLATDLYSDTGALERIVILEEQMSDHGVHMSDTSSEQTHEQWHDGESPPPVIIPPEPPPVVIPPISTPPNNGSEHTGFQVSDVSYWNTCWDFVDLGKKADLWRDPDSRGRIYAYAYAGGHAPPGRYNVTWDGPGRVGFGLAAREISSTSNSAVIEVQYTDKTPIQFQKFGSVSNFKCIRENTPENRVFHPEFIETFRPFKVIRFLDWQKTNSSQIITWEDRPLPHELQGTSKGVSLEYQILLVNKLGADPWFCMPHMADDRYVRKFAEYVRDNVHADAIIRVEWSNEIWNSDTRFRQHQWVKDNSDGASFSNAFFDKWAEESNRDMDIWYEVFGDEAPARLRRVVGTQLALPWITKKMAPRVSGKFDVISPSAYFKTKSSQNPSTVTEMAQMNKSYIENSSFGWFKEHLALARAQNRQVAMEAYEGGQHNNNVVGNALGRSQLIKPLYVLNHSKFMEAGGSLIVYFNAIAKPTDQNNFGHLEWQDQPVEDAPKYEVILELAG